MTALICSAVNFTCDATAGSHRYQRMLPSQAEEREQTSLPSLLFSFVRERSNCKFLQKLYEIVITANDSILWIPALMLAKRAFLVGCFAARTKYGNLAIYYSSCYIKLATITYIHCDATSERVDVLVAIIN
jgi:hypothetical protein